MSYSADIAEGAGAIWDYAGQPVLYRGITGNTKTVTAIVSYDLQEFGAVAEIQGKTATVAVRFSDLPERPRRLDTYEILGGPRRGDVYTVDSILRADDIEHTALTA